MCLASDGDACGSDWSRLWDLDPQVVFLNHGSFGATPRAVLEEQQRLRQQLEAEPVRFFDRELEPLLDQARAELASFVGADPDNLAFVGNATTGVNTVLRSLSFGPSDELLVTDHEYNACRNAVDEVARGSGAKVVVATVPFPVTDPAVIVEQIVSRVTRHTRLLLVDHVTSQTGLVMPVAELVRQLEQRGVPVLVDGAHTPGMLPLDLQRLAASFYTGNCHKWLCAPKGSAFLWVRGDFRQRVRPLVISHGANAPPRRTRFRLEFDWVGTGDPTPALCVPVAIRHLGSLLPGGWPELYGHNHRLAVTARQLLCRALAVAEPCPEAMLGSLASLPLPDGDPPAPPGCRDPLQDALLERYRIEVPVIPWPAPGRRLLRISAQLYNRIEQYRSLATAVTELLAAGY